MLRQPLFLKWWDIWGFSEYLQEGECYSTYFLQMLFPIEIGAYLYILRLWLYEIDYMIRILVSGVLVTSK